MTSIDFLVAAYRASWVRQRDRFPRKGSFHWRHRRTTLTPAGHAGLACFGISRMLKEPIRLG